MQFVIMIVAAALVFGVVIFVHELGHFITAKKSGIKVNEFALGMGPTLFKIKKGETTYALRLLPIGGFVSMEGEDEESSDERSFQRASIPKRLVVMLSGAFMNFVLGFVVLAVLLATGGAMASRTITRIDSDASGLAVGDTITHVNGRRAYIAYDIMYEFYRTQNGTFHLTVQRDGNRVDLYDVAFEVVSGVDEATGEEYEYLNYGFAVQPIEKNFFTVISQAFNTTLSYGRLILLSLTDLLRGRASINDLSGPVGIVSTIGQAVSIGWSSVFNMLAIITINLGIVNLLPFPALDGGRAVLLIIEAIRRKPLNQKFEIALNFVGFVLLMGLMVLVSFNDIGRLLS